MNPQGGPIGGALEAGLSPLQDQGPERLHIKLLGPARAMATGPR
jgi:hypothetical protein